MTCHRQRLANLVGLGKRPYFVTTGHRRLKNGVASLAYDPVVHADSSNARHGRMDCRVEARQ
jgi:hypothetical protein